MKPRLPLIATSLLLLLALGGAWLCYARPTFVETVTAPRKVLGSHEARLWMFSDVALKDYPSGATPRIILQSAAPETLREGGFANIVAIAHTRTWSFQNVRPKMYNLCGTLLKIVHDTPLAFERPHWMNETNYRGGYSPPRLLTKEDLDQPLKDGDVLLFLWD